MKSTIISMIIVIIVMAAVPMLLFDNGKLATSLSFFGPSEDSELSGKTPQNVQQVVTDKKVEVFKWVDEHGITQFGHAPPMEGVESEKIVLLPNTNVVDAIKIVEEEPEIEGKPTVFSLGNPYSPGKMEDIVDESLDIKDKLNERQAEQEKMLQGMQEMFKHK